MPNNLGYLIFVFSALNFVSCTSGKKEHVLAEVGKEKLTLEMVQEVLGAQANEEDIDVKTYLNHWIKERLVLQSAENELSSSEKDFSKELKDYRNSLLRYTLEAKYLADNEDSLISQKEIMDFYEGNSASFSADSSKGKEQLEFTIKNILINKRRVNLIKKMEKQLYEKAIKNGEIKLYLN